MAQNTGGQTLRGALVAGLTLVLVLALLCAWLGYRTHQARQAEQFRDQLIQVARQSAINLTTIDYEHADTDVQRILDSSTGGFYEDFNGRSRSLIDVVKKVRSKSVGAVTEAGLESNSGQEGEVLVAVTVSTTKNGAPDGQPRYWRMRMTVSGSGTDMKVSKVDFVP
jgi:Mce-associated membrane protein